jgi:hypothetical protein
VFAILKRDEFKVNSFGKNLFGKGFLGLSIDGAVAA